jgi:GGDEF domain-containing protein
MITKIQDGTRQPATINLDKHLRFDLLEGYAPQPLKPLDSQVSNPAGIIALYQATITPQIALPRIHLQPRSTDPSRGIFSSRIGDYAESKGIPGIAAQLALEDLIPFEKRVTPLEERMLEQLGTYLQIVDGQVPFARAHLLAERDFLQYLVSTLEPVFSRELPERQIKPNITDAYLITHSRDGPQVTAALHRHDTTMEKADLDIASACLNIPVLRPIILEAMLKGSPTITRLYESPLEHYQHLIFPIIAPSKGTQGLWAYLRGRASFDHARFPAVDKNLARYIGADLRERILHYNSARMHGLLPILSREAGEEELRIRMEETDDGAMPFAVFELDAKGLKLANDYVSRSAGDRFLFNIAKAVKHVTRAGQIIASHGGDEILIITDLQYPDEIAAYDARLKQALRRPAQLLTAEAFDKARHPEFLSKWEDQFGTYGQTATIIEDGKEISVRYGLPLRAAAVGHELYHAGTNRADMFDRIALMQKEDGVHCGTFRPKPKKL